MLVRRTFATACLLVLVFAARTSAAQSSDNVVAAEALFDAGRAAVARGDYGAACPKFIESQKLDPAVGTLINIADCEEHLGHLANAWQTWRQVVDQLPSEDPRRPTVLGRRDAIEKRVPRLTLRLAPGAPAGTEVLRDGVVVPPSVLDIAVPVDPGAHVLEISAPGHERAQQTLTVTEATQPVIVLALGPLVAVAPAPTAPAPDAPPARPASDGSTQRWLGWGALGLGVVGIAVGSVSGLVAIGKKHARNDLCYPANVCTPEGAEVVSDGRTFATLSTVSFIAGGVLAAGGVVLLVTAPRRSMQITPVVTARGSGAVFTGAW